MDSNGRGAPLGNNNNKKNKPWADAIRRALARREETGSGASLNRLAEALLDKAAEGDLSALKELGDRLDGKSAQAVTVSGDDESPLKAHILVEYLAATATGGVPVPPSTAS
jgi:hypothetical protein